jgi:galactan endo-beta-1,3-galactanase
MKRQNNNPMYKTIKTLVGALAFGLLGLTQVHAAWNIGYPWGRTHNGNVYMTHGGDVMNATQPGSNGYKYNSGGSYSTVKLYAWSGDPTMGAQARCNVNSGNVRGVWPAFWFTTEGAWTGEVDIAEWKGNNNNSQNTYDGGWEVTLTNSNNQVYKAHCWIVGTTNNMRVDLSINNVVKGQHTGNNFRNKNFWLIRNLQMEGSSGSPGPASAQYTVNGISQW